MPSYTPVNVAGYVAAFSGAMAGMAVSGWVTGNTPTDVTAVAGAFAQEFDIVWNSATPLNSLEAQAIAQITSEEFSKRGPGPILNPAFTNPSNWLQAATACAMLVLQSDAYFAGQGIVPPPVGGGDADKVLIDVSDTTAGFLASKLVAGTSIALTVLNPGANEQLRIDLLTAFSVTSFTRPAGSLVLVGASIINPSFTAAYNQLATAVTLTDTEGNTDVIALPGTAIVSPHTFTKNAYGQSVTWTDTAAGPTGTGSASRAFTLSWGQNVYFGSIVDPGIYDSAFVTALAATLKLAPAGTYAYNASALQSCFFCARTAFGLTPSNFTVGPAFFACSKVATVAVTNANGIVENFDVFRSDNIGLGAFNLVES